MAVAADNLVAVLMRVSLLLLALKHVCNGPWPTKRRYSSVFHNFHGLYSLQNQFSLHNNFHQGLQLFFIVQPLIVDYGRSSGQFGCCADAHDFVVGGFEAGAAAAQALKED